MVKCVAISPDDIANELRDLLLEEVYSQRQAIGH